MKILESEKEFKDFLKENDKVLIDFYTLWCGPCKTFTPTLEKVSEELTDIKFAKVDIEKVDGIAEDYEVDVVPTIIFFKDGKFVAKQEGAMGKTALKKWLTKLTEDKSE